MWPESVWVAPEQAARAQELLAQPQAGAAADAVRQMPPPVQLKMREGGMLDVEGDTQAVRQWLEGAGIPTGALMDGPRKVVVTAGSVERAKQALAEQIPVAHSANSGEPVVPPLWEERLGVGGPALMQPKAGTDALISEGNPMAERVEASSTTSDPNNRQARAARQPPPVQMSMLPDGRLNVKGDARAVRAWLAESGIETRFVTKVGDGVVVIQRSAENARWALAQLERLQELMSGGAVRARGNVTFDKGLWPYPKELRAGQVLADHGYNVQFLVTANDQKKPGVRTADTNIEGLGFLEIYSPTTDKVDNIVRMIVQKNQQAPALFVQTDLDDAIVHSIAGRVWGNPRTSKIKLIFFQRSNGTLVEGKWKIRKNKMPKMACKCGHVMNLSSDDNPYEFSIVPETIIGGIGEKIADGKMVSAAEFFADIDRASIIVCRCTECGRIYLGNADDPGYSLYERVG